MEDLLKSIKLYEIGKNIRVTTIVVFVLAVLLAFNPGMITPRDKRFSPNILRASAKQTLSLPDDSGYLVTLGNEQRFVGDILCYMGEELIFNFTFDTSGSSDSAAASGLEYIRPGRLTGANVTLSIETHDAAMYVRVTFHQDIPRWMGAITTNPWFLLVFLPFLVVGIYLQLKNSAAKEF